MCFIRDCSNTQSTLDRFLKLYFCHSVIWTGVFSPSGPGRLQWDLSQHSRQMGHWYVALMAQTIDWITGRQWGIWSLARYLFWQVEKCKAVAKWLCLLRPPIPSLLHLYLPCKIHSDGISWYYTQSQKRVLAYRTHQDVKALWPRYTCLASERVQRRGLQRGIIGESLCKTGYRRLYGPIGAVSVNVHSMCWALWVPVMGKHKHYGSYIRK